MTEATFEIIREVLVRQACDNSKLLGYDQLEILCDKHGGRNRYHSPLCHAFPESWFEIVEESAAISSYRASIFGVDSRWSFRAKGDNIVPCSAASMIAKWMRELQMSKLNAFWRAKVDALVPTAGYPVDAKRFAVEIEAVAERLGMQRDDWWRRA